MTSYLIAFKEQQVRKTASMSGKGAKGLSGKGAKGTMGDKKGGDKKKPVSRSARAGLQFPVGRIHRLLKVRTNPSPKLTASFETIVKPNVVCCACYFGSLSEVPTLAGPGVCQRTCGSNCCSLQRCHSWYVVSPLRLRNEV